MYIYIYMYVCVYIYTQPFRSGIYFSISLGLLCTLLPPNLWPIETGNTRVFDDPLPTSYGHETLHRENQVWTTGNVGYLVFGRPPTIMGCYSDIFMGLVLWLSAIIHNSLAGGAHRYVDRVAAVTWIWSLTDGSEVLDHTRLWLCLKTDQTCSPLGFTYWPRPILLSDGDGNDTTRFHGDENQPVWMIQARFGLILGIVDDVRWLALCPIFLC